MENVISFKDFTWQYSAQMEPTLKGLNLDICQGEKLLICGPSGCGKSTIGHCLNGLIPFSYRGENKGSLTIMGKESKELSLFDISKMVGTVLQDSDGQFVGLTVAEDIAFALENDNVPQEELFKRVKKAAETVGISGHLDYAPGEISGGQKQRVSIAGVMVDNVPIFLFDEPLANLDPAAGQATIELIDEIHKRTGATIIIIEHRIEDVLHRKIDRIVLMGEGEIDCVMTPNELLSTELLSEHGIREPLYITALKYAGVKITPEMLPESIDTLRLSEEDKAKVREWFRHTPAREIKHDDDVILGIRDISFAYTGKSQNSLNDISFDIHPGEMMAIAGRNGAGKSTLAKLLCGFEIAQEGTITMADIGDLSELSIKEHADHIGYVMQNPNQMISKVMIREEVALGLVTRGVGEEEQLERTDKALKICGLYPFRSWPISALSFGQKKRVTIASILALEPEVVILDEPTAGQDYRHYTEIMEFLKELNESGVTVIMITHDMHLMLEYCERAVVFSDTRKIADSTPARILTDDAVIEKASLKKTSLYDVAMMTGLDPSEFAQRFIDYEKEARND